MFFVTFAFTLSPGFSKDGSTDPIRVWKILPSSNPLVQLAHLLFSFIPNSAETERLFSHMGDIKTKKRNRLGIQKLRDCALIKGEIWQQQMKDGTAKLRAKRDFGNKTTSFVGASQSQLDDVEVIQEALDNLDCDDDSEPEERGTWLADGEETGFSALAHQFTAEADANSGAESEESDTGERDSEPSACRASSAGQRRVSVIDVRVTDKVVLTLYPDPHLFPPLPSHPACRRV